VESAGLHTERIAMQVHYRFGVGVTFFFPCYEKELAIKMMRAIIKEGKLIEKDTNEFNNILLSIIEENNSQQ
jgi:hypothetical protein